MDKVNNKYFIKTSDKQTAEYLRNAGFPELAKEGDRWVFVNDVSKIKFSVDDTKVNYSDVLTI